MDNLDSEKQDQQQQKDRLSRPKGTFPVKLGFFFGYNGEKFQGMQYQREHTNTIQNILHGLLVENGFILKSNAHELRRIKWSRAARTDKKVHALCNGISMKIQINQKYVADPETRQVNYNRIICDLNDQLPMDIRILVLRKVGKGFDMRHDAKTRVYNYIIPSRLFQGFAKFKEDLPIEGEQLNEVVQKLNYLVKFYLGTHNFFNFTRGYKKTDPRCDRYMIKMHAEKVEESTVKTILKQCQRDQQKQYQSFIRFTLVGQSFIYHQIRKMIGLLIKIFSQELDGEQAIKKAFSPEQYDTYLAPGQGLYLNRMTFESYNSRKDTREKIQFTQDQEQRINKYRAYLETKIIKHEIQESVFTGWMNHRADWEKKQSEQQIQQSGDQQTNKRGNQNQKSNRNNNKPKKQTNKRQEILEGHKNSGNGEMKIQKIEIENKQAVNE